MSENIFYVKFSELSGKRIDPHYHKPYFKDIEVSIQKFKLSNLKNESIKIFSGTTPKSDTNAYTSQIDGIPFIRSGDFNERGHLDYNSIVYITNNLHLNSMRSSQLMNNDVLFAIVGATIGKVGIYKGENDANINQAICAIRLKETLLPEYVITFFNTEIGQKIIDKVKRPVARANINLSEIGSLPIPVPPMEIQNQIVSIMDNAYKQKEQKEKEAKNKLDSIDSYLLNELGITLPKIDEKDISKRMFVRKFSEISGNRLDPFYNNVVYSKIDNELQNGKYNLESIKKLCYSVSGVIYSKQDEREKGLGILRANNITLESNELNFNDVKYIRDDFEISEKLLLKSDDILMSSASGSKEHVGKVAYIEKNLNYYFGGFMMVLRQQNTTYLQRYLFEFLQSKIFRMYLFKNLGGTNINNLSFNMISHLQIPLPPIEIQNKIAEHIQKLRDDAQSLKNEAMQIFENAKKDVEKIILGE